MEVKALISCEELKNIIESNTPGVKVFECRMLDKEVTRGEYEKQHIPTAQYLDMWEGVDSTYLRPKNLPQPHLFQEYCRSLGIDNDDHIVLYDYEMYYGARLWYQFKAFGHEKVSVLDGGLPYWIKQGYPIETGKSMPTEKQGKFTVRRDTQELFKGYDYIINDVLPKSIQTLDVRNPSFFDGTKQVLPRELVQAMEFSGLPNTLDPNKLHKGHLPRSVNIENKTFIDEGTNCMITKEQFLKKMGAAGLDVNKPLLITCYLGVTACLVPLVASKLEKHGEMTIYGGSWTEFSQKAPASLVES